MNITHFRDKNVKFVRKDENNRIFYKDKLGFIHIVGEYMFSFLCFTVIRTESGYLISGIVKSKRFKDCWWQKIR